MATADTDTSKEELKKMSKAEFYARSLGWVLLFTAVTVAVVFGMRNGMAYVEKLGMDSKIGAAVSYLIAGAGYLVAGFMGVMTSNNIEKAYYSTTFGEAETQPSPAAA